MIVYMYMCVCMHVCVCMYVCMYVCTVEQVETFCEELRSVSFPAAQKEHQELTAFAYANGFPKVRLYPSS